MASLYERIGGEAAVMTAVDLFYEKVCLLSLDAFLELPLNERIVYILQRQVEFFADGRPVEREIALRSLRAATAGRV